MTNQRITNQDLYRKRDAVYLLQNKLATAKEDDRAELLEQKTKLENELKDMVEVFASGRQYCNDHTCGEYEQPTKHVKHMSDSGVL